MSTHLTTVLYSCWWKVEERVAPFKCCDVTVLSSDSCYVCDVISHVSKQVNMHKWVNMRKMICKNTLLLVKPKYSECTVITQVIITQMIKRTLLGGLFMPCFHSSARDAVGIRYLFQFCFPLQLVPPSV